MTDTPERIALRWQPGVTSALLMGHPDYTQYVRADVAAAMVAAEREACAAIARDYDNPLHANQAVAFNVAGAIFTAIRKRGQQ